jgi:glycopeptide antibiotics resistance protein
VRELARTLWLVTVLGIVYGTLIPFEFHGDMDLARERALAALQADAPWSGRRGLSTTDLVQNLLLFVPFGFFARLARVGLAPALAGAVLLSTTVECLQLLTLNRTTSWLDIATNGAGAMGGYLFAPRLLRTVTGLYGAFVATGFSGRAPGRVASALLALAVIHHLEPFAFTLDIGHAWQQLKGLTQTFFLKPQGGDGLTFLHWFLAGSLLIAGMRERIAVSRYAVALGALALAAEFSQFLIRARVPGFHDLLVAWAGIAAGLAFSLRRQAAAPAGTGRGPGGSDGAALLATLVLFLAACAWDLLYPFELERFHGVTWLPFQPSYARTTFTTLSNNTELVLAGMASGIVFGSQAPSRAARNVALLLALAGFALLEFCQAWVVGRYSDTGDVIALALGMWIGGRLVSVFLQPSGRPGPRDPIRSH